MFSRMASEIAQEVSYKRFYHIYHVFLTAALLPLS